jgi:hypothetical protein
MEKKRCIIQQRKRKERKKEKRKMREIFVLSCTNSSNYENFLEKHSPNFQCQNLKKENTMYDPTLKRKERRKERKTKRGEFLCFSSANSTNYANFLEIVFKWKKNPVQLNKKNKNENVFKKIVQIQLIMLISWGKTFYVIKLK